MEDIYDNYCQHLEEDIHVLLTEQLGLNLDVLWLKAKSHYDTFELRTEAFFILFKEMLRRGHLKLQRDDKIIEHTPEEWEEIFRAAWPKTDSPYGAYEGDICIWFTDDPCPAYAVWVDPETGEYEWST